MANPAHAGNQVYLLLRLENKSLASYNNVYQMPRQHLDMDHLIKRSGHHSNDVVLFASAAGDPVYPSRLEQLSALDYRYAGGVRGLCASSEKSTMLLILDARAPAYLKDLQNIARTALVNRVIAGVPLADHITVLVLAEETDYPELFSDPAIAAVAPTLERNVKDMNCQLDDSVTYVLSVNHADVALRKELADASAMALELSRIIREYQAAPSAGTQGRLAQAVAQRRPLYLELQGMHANMVGDDIDAYSDLQKHLSKTRHLALELNAVIREFLGMPCSSLEKDMYRLLDRYSSLLKVLEQEQGDDSSKVPTP